MTPPFFSIVVAHYQGSVSPEEYQRCYESLPDVHDPDVEVLVFHDGPLLHIDDGPFHIETTPARANVTGHNLRRLGIERATGTWLLHINADGCFAPDLFPKLRAELETLTTDIAIGSVEMRGLHKKPGYSWYDTPRNPHIFTVLHGQPLRLGNIDIMQFIAKTSLWKHYGWPSLSPISDWQAVDRMTREHAHTYLPLLIGRHY